MSPTSLLRSRPQASQPTVERVNAQHPDARGLCWLSSGRSLVDVTSNSRAGAGLTQIQTESRVVRDSAIGHATSYESGGGFIYPRWKTSKIDFTDKPFSILYVGAIPSSTNFGVLLSNHGGSNQWRLQSNYLANGTSSGATTAGALSLLTYDGSWATVGASGVCDGKVHAYLFRRIGSTLEFWMDGRLLSTSTAAATNVSAGKAAGLGLYWNANGSGDDATGNYAADSTFLLGAAWATAVDPKVSVEPWSLFAARASLIPASQIAGPSFLPARNIPVPREEWNALFDFSKGPQDLQGNVGVLSPMPSTRPVGGAGQPGAVFASTDVSTTSTKIVPGLSSAITAFIVIEPRGVANNNSNFLFGETAPASGAYNWGLYSSSSNYPSAFVHNGTSGAAAIYTFYTWHSHPGPQVWVMTYGGGDNNVRLYHYHANGLTGVMSSVSQTGNIQRDVSATLSIQRWSSAGESFRLLGAGVINRRMSAGEVQQKFGTLQAALNTISPRRRAWVPTTAGILVPDAPDVANASIALTASSPAGVQTHQGSVSNASVVVTADSVAGGSTFNGAVANAAVAVSASAPAGVQTHQGTVTNAAVATTVSAPAGVQTHQGGVANASIATTASTVAGSSSATGAVSNAAVALAASTVVGVQTHQGAVANATITTTASTVAGSGSGTGVISNAAVQVTASTPAGTQAHQGAVSPASVGTTASTPAGVQTHQGAVSNAVVSVSASTVVGTVGGYNGAVSSAAVAVVAGSVAGLQTHVGALSGATISLTAVAPAGVQEHQGAVSSSTVSLQASAVAGGVSYNGVVASALIAVSASNPVGTQVHQGAVSNVIIPVLASVAGPLLGLPLTVSAMRTYLVPVDQPGDLYGPYYRPTPPTWTHEPSARLDYAVDWVDWLADGGDAIDTVDARVVDGALGLSITTFDKRNDTQVAAMVVPTDTNNLPAPGTAVDVTFRITTNNLRADERTVTLVIQER